jgi:eukaryotic-like serine/threonine-protein kinase
MQSGQRLGPYVIEGLLKRGGMANVYRGRAVETGRAVAIKVLPPLLASDSVSIARFKNEVVQVRKLAHPHIVPIESFGEEGPYTYFVMPLLDASLRDLLLRQGALAPHAAVDTAKQIAGALSAVHELGLIHRDIKPDNILFDQGRALLTDFGIVRQVNFGRAEQTPTLADSGLPIGTPQYMAPEQLACQPVDHRVDIYALGAVIYEMLTGRPPHTGETPYAVAMRALTEPILPPSARTAAVWPALDAVVVRALARNQQDRYPTAAGLRLALERVGGGPNAAPSTVRPSLMPAKQAITRERPSRWPSRSHRCVG